MSIATAKSTTNLVSGFKHLIENIMFQPTEKFAQLGSMDELMKQLLYFKCFSKAKNQHFVFLLIIREEGPTKQVVILLYQQKVSLNGNI